VELLKDGGIRLLVFDPSHSKTQMEHFGNTATSANGMRLIRRPLVAMKARQYQIVVVAGIMETDQEFQQSKIVRSIYFPNERWHEDEKSVELDLRLWKLKLDFGLNLCKYASMSVESLTN